MGTGIVEADFRGDKGRADTLQDSPSMGLTLTPGDGVRLDKVRRSLGFRQRQWGWRSSLALLKLGDICLPGLPEGTPKPQDKQGISS